MEQTLTKEQWAQQKQEERKAAFAAIDTLTDTTFCDEHTLKAYLNMQAKMGKLGVSNTLLVLGQKPDATQINSYDDWAENGRSVVKGAKAIDILEADREYQRTDGSLAMGFKIKKVFDISSTHGKPIKDYRYPSSLKQHISNEWANSDLKGKSELETACIAAIVGSRYGVEPKTALPEIPDEVKNMDTRDKRELLQDIREAAVDIIERVDKALYQERQQQKSQAER